VDILRNVIASGYVIFAEFVLAPQHETSCDSEITTKEDFDHRRKQLKKAT